ncbi:SLC13 family permease [Psychrobacillus lasiicapitis]|uniref:Sodium-dependent dicarboxylate transporter SdcS n=1 Tax=Psychrobacillus lasiicapitis TaxID=1636719 RepID=A0A544T2X6_9BACI|nr:DASS family sodium-coupled anion symporter [Psychrobacillus lasiicapitis]TQR11785.1 DASS family sodium-coupled anion symporter [Psychrobacillus lasiicapitis]GGA19382.1 membrane protein [Psychrobacillus lasiicapitis]
MKIVKNKDFKTYAYISLAIAGFLFMFFLLPDTFSTSAKLMTSIITFGIILWSLEPIPIGLTGLIILLLMLVFNIADSSVIFSGFASPATYLIVAGMMLATAVNDTSLIKRMTYMILKKWGSSAKGLLGSVIIIQQIQSFFIPSTAVRTALVVPVSTMIISTVGAKPGSNFRKMIMLGVAFGGVISGSAVMTAAIGNILTVEILNRFAGVSITYFQWFFYTFPLWFILIPAIWILLLKVFPLPKEQQYFPKIEEQMQIKLEELGTVNRQEIICMIILFFIVVLWLTEPVHGMHPSIPALIGVVLMTLPKIGIADWESVIKINYNTILLLSVTLSMGYTFVDSGAADTISDYLSVPSFMELIQNPLLAVFIVILMAQLFHKMISNVSTAVVVLVPIIISVAQNAGVDPLAIGFATGLTCVFGFMFVVESMSNLLVHSTGMIEQRDFLKPGLYATIITIIATIVVAATWWRWIGLI